MLQTSLLGCHRATRSVLGPLSPSFDPHSWLSDALTSSLTEEDHCNLSGKLHISLTKVYDGRNMLVSQFSTKEELKRVSLSDNPAPQSLSNISISSGNSVLLFHPCVYRTGATQVPGPQSYRRRLQRQRASAGPAHGHCLSLLRRGSHLSPPPGGALGQRGQHHPHSQH